MSDTTNTQPWGPETPYHISVPDSSLELLKKKLELATFPDEIDAAEWDYGVPLAEMKRLVEYWKTKYDWRAQEKELNESLPQFIRNIHVDGGFGDLNIHYVHQKSKLGSAIPLLFVHGWPGSFLEVRHVLPLLIQESPDHPSFHVVAISLPGFGFSEGSKKRGFKLAQYAEVCNKLMLSLGYNEYVTQGGDWGSAITRTIAKLYGPKHSKAWHTNFLLLPTPTWFTHPLTCLHDLVLHNFLFWTGPGKLDALNAADTAHFQNTGLGYFAIHGTKPQTIGYNIADSPVGLLAWIYEKLIAWTDNKQWSDDEVLNLVSIYLFSTAGPTAAGRIYFETQDDRVEQPGFWQRRPTTPFGMSYFPKEVLKYPRSWVRNVGNLVFESQHDKGGHFAATEQPDALVDDVRKMFGKGGPAYGVVSGLTGYAN